MLAQTGIDRHGCQQPLAALDARMGEIYWAVYRRDEQGLARLQGAERLSTIEPIDFDSELDRGLGHCWLDELVARADFAVDPGLLPDARSMLKLAAAAASAGTGVEAAAASINYLRNRVAEKAAS